MTIDGYSQPQASENTQAVGSNATLLIELNGSGAGGNANGLVINGDDSSVQGLVINRFGIRGIRVESGSTNNTIAANTTNFFPNFRPLFIGELTSTLTPYPKSSRSMVKPRRFSEPRGNLLGRGGESTPWPVTRERACR